jgi:hypothetical protein
MLAGNRFADPPVHSRRARGYASAPSP